MEDELNKRSIQQKKLERDLKGMSKETGWKCHTYSILRPDSEQQNSELLVGQTYLLKQDDMDIIVEEAS